MRRLLVLSLTAAALMAVAAVPAVANHDKGGTNSYTLGEKVTKLTKKQALEMLVEDLSRRVNAELGKAKNAKCTVKKRSATCSYKAANPLGAALGVDSAFCVKKGKLKITSGGMGANVTQKAKDC
jgi:hypothetical protein